jgi:hypothetical protein
MTIPRMVGLSIALALLGIAVVAVRLEQARHMRQIQMLQFRQADLRQKIWTQEMELARLRSPQMIRERAARFGVEAGLQRPAIEPVKQ